MIFVSLFWDHIETKHTESASLPDVLSEYRDGGRCAEPEPEGQGQSTPSTTSHEETSGWFTDEVGLVFIPWNYLYVCNWQNKYFLKQTISHMNI